MQAMDAEVDGGPFAHLDYLFLYLFLNFGHDLFDAGRMNTTVGNELV